MRKRIAHCGALLAIVGLLAAGPGTAFAGTNIHVKTTLGGGKTALKVHL